MESNIVKIVRIGLVHYACSSELPKKNQDIIVEHKSGEYTLMKSHKDLSLEGCYVDGKRYVWPVSDSTSNY